MIVTDADRAKARAEHEQQRVRMSEAAKAKLREQNEADKRDEVEEARLYAQFLKLRRDAPNYANAIFQIMGGSPHIVRMARKLLAAGESGLVPTLRHASSDIVFLSTLTPAEEEMSDAEFDAEMKQHAAMRHKFHDTIRPKRGSLEEKQRQMRKRVVRTEQPAINVPVAA